ncbi:hypothetical protein GQR58_029672 [Nymphon striatum]|nr:hypothetical protein GQR58_029672 [Nymphon striatum]
MPQVFAVTRQVGADEGHMESADEEGGIQQQVGLGVRGSSELLAQGPLRRVGLRLGEVGASATAKGWSEHDGGKREECKRHHGRLPAPAFDEEAGERHQQELAHRSGCTHNAKCHGSALGADHATHRREHHREARRAHGQAGQETASQDDHEGALGGGEQQQGQGVQQRAASKRDGPAVSIRDSPGERLTQTPHDRLDSDRDTPRALHAVEHRFDDRIKEYAVGRPHAERHRGENATEGDDNRYGIRASSIRGASGSGHFASVRRKRSECFGCWRDAQVDAVGHACFLPEGFADRGPLVADIACDQCCVRGQFLGDHKGRVSGEGPNFHNRRRTEQTGEQRHETSLREPDLHGCRRHLLCGVDQALFQGAWCRGVGADVVGDAGLQERDVAAHEGSR